MQDVSTGTTNETSVPRSTELIKPLLRFGDLPASASLIFKSNVLSVLLYASGCWKTKVTIERKLEVIQNKCLRCTLKAPGQMKTRISDHETMKDASEESC